MSADAAPAPAPASVALPEQVAIVVLLIAYFILWVPLFVTGFNVIALFIALQKEVWQIVQRLWQAAGAIPRNNYELAGMALLYNLICASLLLAVLAVARLLWRNERLRGRWFWHWVTWHGVGLLVGMSGSVIYQIIDHYYSPASWQDILIIGDTFLIACIGFYGLSITRTRR